MPEAKPVPRTAIVAGNWKMNLNVAESLELVHAMRDQLQETAGVERVLCPPFVSLVPVKEALRGTSIKLGAQNAFWKESGAYTGEVSPTMLASLCDYVILGHSERRQFFGETDEIVNRKIEAALRVGLGVIFCVGENLAENEAGRTEEVVSRQVRRGLAGIPSLASVVVAYEPIWAIGTGRAARGADAALVIDLIRRTVRDLYGAAAAEAVRIQYGGSVNRANIAEFIREPGIDGALVGGASLKAEEFVAIVRQTAEAKADSST